MSRSSKLKAREQRKKKKLENREKRRAHYLAQIDAGKNRKSRTRTTTRRLVRAVRHRNGRCGNVGCGACGLGKARPRSTVTLAAKEIAASASEWTPSYTWAAAVLAGPGVVALGPTA